MALIVSFILGALAVYAQPIYRLPNTVLPINYNLQIHPDIPNSNFNGIESIQIDITNAYFDGADLSTNFDVSFNYYPNNNMQISVAELRVTGATTATYALDNLALDPDTQIATPTFAVTKGDIQTALGDAANVFTLYMEYSANIRGGSDLAGLYKSTYVFSDVTVENLVTQFQATDARSAFPCFDEPAFKATFDITLIGPVDAVILSNMPSTSTQPTAEYQCQWTSPMGESKTECEMVTFAQTPIMSTYLVAIVIGGYLNVNDLTATPTQTVYYPLTFEQNRAQFALDESLQVLELFGGADGFNIPYTESGINKLDSVGVSDFAAGAMENWGLMIYRTVRLLVDPDLSSQSAKNGQILIIAHEIAHQWFGNLVSPSWWDDLWLSEGFATYMSFYGGNRVEPEYNLMESKIQNIANIMIDDSSVFTQAVKQEIDGDPTQILSGFSQITYQKGMGVINTMANIMGNAQFLSGISTYLDTYKFSTATSEQLGAVLDQTSAGIGELMDSYINQEGFPLIWIETVNMNEAEITFQITQQRFVKQGPEFYGQSGAINIPFVDESMVESFAEQLWTVPMLWRDAQGQVIIIDGTDNNILKVRSVNSTKARIQDGPEFYLVNPIDGGSEITEGLFSYFRVYYDDYSLSLLVDNWTMLGKQDQFLIISDRYALMLASYIKPEEYLNFVQSVTNKMIEAMEPMDIVNYYGIFNVITKSLLDIDDIFCELEFDGNGNNGMPTNDDIALRGYFRDFSRTLLRRVLELIVNDINMPFAEKHDNCPVNSDCNVLQSVLLEALVRLNDRQIITAAYDMYYLCENRVCENQELCEGCNAPKFNDSRIAYVSENVLQAMIAGILSFDTTNDNALNDMIALYGMVNIEQQTYILNAFGALYLSYDQNKNADLINKAFEFIMSDAVRGNMKINALVSMKVCTAREPLWEFITSPTGNGDETVYDSLFDGGSGLFSQEPLTKLGDAFASMQKYDEVAAFFNNASFDRINAGTQRNFNQSIENIWSRFLWKEQHQDEMQLYMRTYIVDKYEDSFEIWQIVLITIGCCAGLVCMVLAFWGVSRPTDSDRMVHYMSLKRMKRERRKSSLSQQGPYSAMNASLDRSLKGVGGVTGKGECE